MEIVLVLADYTKDILIDLVSLAKVILRNDSVFFSLCVRFISLIYYEATYQLLCTFLKVTWP